MQLLSNPRRMLKIGFKDSSNIGHLLGIGNWILGICKKWYNNKHNSHSMKSKILIFSLALFIVPFFASAAGLVPCGGPTESPCTVKDVFVMIARVTNTLIGLAGIYAVFEVISGAFWLIPTMGDEEAITKNRKRINQAVVGFVMVMFAYMFVNTAVNYLLLEAAKNKNCKLDLSDPLNYLYIHADPDKHKVCRK